MNVAISTCGLAVYNALAIKGPSTVADIIVFNSELDFPMTLAAAVSALGTLVELGRVEKLPSGIFRARGPQGGIVRSRPRNGNGWNGWLVDAPNLGRRLLDEVIHAD